MRKLMLLVACAALEAVAGGYGSKVIYHGWDVGLATPADVLKHADAFDRLSIDGISLKLRGARDGSTVDATYRAGEFDDLVSVYRQITAHKSLRESFLLCGTMPYKRGVRYAWTDDAAWARIGANFRELARVAKAGGLKGLMIDNEDYCRSNQFRHVPEADGDWAAATRRVRARGRDFFRGIFAEYPDVTLLFFWAYIDNEYAHLSPDPEAALRASGRLTCAFLDGMLDVMPPTARFVEGNENAYAYEAFRGDFDRHAVEVLSDMVKVVAPENRAKYRAHVRNGYGLYLDEFVNDPIRRRKGQPDRPNHWYRGPRNGSRAEHFREIVEGALRAADEYVWVYGEKFAAIDWGNTLDQNQWSLKFDQRTTWDETIVLSPKLALLRGVARRGNPRGGRRAEPPAGDGLRRNGGRHERLDDLLLLRGHDEPCAVCARRLHEGRRARGGLLASRRRVVSRCSAGVVRRGGHRRGARRGRLAAAHRAAARAGGRRCARRAVRRPFRRGRVSRCGAFPVRDGRARRTPRAGRRRSRGARSGESGLAVRARPPA